MSIVAQYLAPCAADCGSPIEPGQPIEFLEPARRPSGAGGWQHVTCPETKTDAADRVALTQPRCDRCGLNHAGEC